MSIQTLFPRLILPFCCILLLPLLSVAQPAPDTFEDQTQLPAGLRGQHIQALLQAANSNDPVQIRQFFEQHVAEQFRLAMPMEAHIGAFQDAHRTTGGVDFYSVRTYNPARPKTVVIVQDRLFGGYSGVTMIFDGPEDRIAELNFSPARTPKAALTASPALSEAELLRTIHEKLEMLCKKDAFSGTVLIARGDQVLLERACGEASKSWHMANTIDTKFNLGSMNKMFTSTAVAQLAEKGRLRLDDPISKYVDTTWLPRSITDRVTVHHLLTHTSGLGSYFNDAYFKSSRDLFRQLDDYKPLVKGDTLEFTPGSRFGYSNTGMLLLGVVIEKASGANYFDYIRQNIYQPAGMTRSDCYELDQPQENLAEGYVPQAGGQWKNNLFLHVLKGGPAGGGYSTVRDLHRFARALQTGKLVEPASLEKMWTSHSEAGYGYGFNVEQTPAGKAVGHGGGFPGLNSHLDLLLDKGYIIVVMSNHDSGAEALRAYLRNLISTRLKS